MARARHQKSDRDGVRFLLLPHVVLDAPAFLRLSAYAVRLLIDIARQHAGDNNGKLLASNYYLATRGWKSHDTAHKSRRELEAAGFIVQTRKGAKPKKAAWFAVTWAGLDWTPEMEIAKATFERELRGLYCKNDPLPAIMKMSCTDPRHTG